MARGSHGEVNGPTSGLYPYVIAPAWVISDGATAYTIAKSINAFLLSLVVWPVWLLARDLGGRIAAVAAVALLVAGMWMETSARLMTESLALPAATAALVSTVVYLQRRKTSWLALAFVSVAVATLADADGDSPPDMAGAITADVLRRPMAEWRSAASASRVGLIATWGTTAPAAIVLKFARDEVSGYFSALLDPWSHLAQAAEWAGDYASDLSVMVGLIPWIASIALILRRDVSAGPVVRAVFSVLW